MLLSVHDLDVVDVPVDILRHGVEGFRHQREFVVAGNDQLFLVGMLFAVGDILAHAPADLPGREAHPPVHDGDDAQDNEDGGDDHIDRNHKIARPKGPDDLGHRHIHPDDALNVVVHIVVPDAVVMPGDGGVADEHIAVFVVLHPEIAAELPVHCGEQLRIVDVRHDHPGVTRLPRLFGGVLAEADRQKANAAVGGIRHDAVDIGHIRQRAYGIEVPGGVFELGRNVGVEGFKILCDLAGDQLDPLPVLLQIGLIGQSVRDGQDDHIRDQHQRKDEQQQSGKNRFRFFHRHFNVPR